MAQKSEQDGPKAGKKEGLAGQRLKSRKKQGSSAAMFPGHHRASLG